ncbi:MAG: hypothetical protein Q9218_003262 [Villophora microphyllina]
MAHTSALNSFDGGGHQTPQKVVTSTLGIPGSSRQIFLPPSTTAITASTLAPLIYRASPIDPIFPRPSPSPQPRDLASYITSPPFPARRGPSPSTPPSTTTTHAQLQHQSNSHETALPGLATLASLAASSSPQLRYVKFRGRCWGVCRSAEMDVARPLKTDVIKSRNRVRTAIPGQKRKVRKLPDGPNGQPQAENAPPQAPQAQMRRTSAGHSDPSDSPISRTITPAAQHLSNIAPQHLFDGASLSDHNFSVSTSLPSFNIRQPSPGSTSSQHDPHPNSGKPSYERLLQENTELKTRVSELEVINILYKGQVGEQDQKATESLDRVQQEKDDLKRRVEELEQEVADLRGEEPAPKRRRTSNETEYPDPSAT